VSVLGGAGESYDVASIAYETDLDLTGMVDISLQEVFFHLFYAIAKEYHCKSRLL